MLLFCRQQLAKQNIKQANPLRRNTLTGLSTFLIFFKKNNNYNRFFKFKKIQYSNKESWPCLLSSWKGIPFSL